jgi:hypothetical protein
LRISKKFRKLIIWNMVFGRSIHRTPTPVRTS